MKSSIVYDWIVDKGGGEKVLEALLSILPSTVHTLFYQSNPDLHPYLQNSEIKTSFLQHLPSISRHYRSLLPLFPLALKSLDVSSSELVISISHMVAKAIKVNPSQCHICYCFTPLRPAWALEDAYFKRMNPLKKIVCKTALHFIRKWDYKSAQNLSFLVANSHYIAERILRCWGKKASVIYPPVHVNNCLFKKTKEDFYLSVSRLVPYKRVDIIAQAFSYMPDKKLIIVGDGPELKNIQKRASKNVHVLGYQKDYVVKELMSKAKAFVYAAEEDFGIVNVEAQASGTPVVAFGKGGAKETVIENRTGVFFFEQNCSSLINSIAYFEKNQELFDPYAIRKHAEKFSCERFLLEFKSYVEKALEIHHENYSAMRR